MTHHGWHPLDPGLWWREYRFSGEARATTLAIRGDDGSVIVVSPGTGLTEPEYAALSALGEVRALIANNHYHHLGQRAWRERFPQARTYAPPGAVAALEKKAPGLGFLPLDQLALPAHVRWEDPPGFRAGEALLRIMTARGTVWYTGDLLTNITVLPPPPLRWLFTWTGSAPGLHVFRPAVWLFVRDRKALRAWLLDRLAAEPAIAIVPAHGEPVEGPEVAALAQAEAARL